LSERANGHAGDQLTALVTTNNLHRLDTRAIIVLVAEDHDDTRDLFVLSLRQAGFEAYGAGSMAHARDLLATVPPDVLVADYALGGDGSGADLLARCRGAPPRVCIMVTGYDPKDVDSTGYQLVLTKPVLGDQLVDAVRARLRAS
jgi:hypothetical protein